MRSIPSLIWSTVAVSMMSWVVAPQCTKPAHLTDLRRDLFDDVEDRIPDVLRAYPQTLEIDLRCVSSIGNGGSSI
jgi:hypothetical protein